MSMIVKAQTLRRGDVLLLPFSKTATLRTVPTVGRLCVTFTTEYGSARLEVNQEVEIKDRPKAIKFASESIVGPEVLRRMGY